MIGFNGGLIGAARDTSSLQSVPGIWTPVEQVVARRRKLWPGEDPNFSSVSLLLHGDGTNGSTTIIDSSLSPKTVTVFGGAVVSTDQSKYGGASLRFPTTSSYLGVANSADFSFGSGDFTIECWVYMSAQTDGSKGLVTYWNASSGVGPWALVVAPNSTSPVFYWNYSGGFEGRLITGSAFASNSWNHLAVVRSGSLLNIYQNGSSTASSNVSTNSLWTGYTGRLTIANDAGADTARNYIGFIDDLRITKGVARYTGNFTPPDAL